MNTSPSPRVELFDISVRSVTMGEIAQSVAHLSDHIISSLSKASAASDVGPSGRVFEGPIGFLNHARFLQSLAGGRRSEAKPAPSRLLARFLPPPPPPQHEAQTAVSRMGANFEAEEVDEGLNARANPASGESEGLQQRALAVAAAAEEQSRNAALSDPDVFEAFSEALHSNGNAGGAVSKEDLGRATWTFLHTLSAQFPEHPTKQQQRDAKDLMSILSRIYPCKECADHFKEVLKAHPVEAKSADQLAQWMCRVHNVVNRSLGKDQFPCHRVDLRWGALDCDEGVCDLHGRLFK